jgi:hypothetical protein
MRKILMMFTPLLFALGACETLTVQTPPASCSQLIPAAWRTPVPSTPPPAAVPPTFGTAEQRALEGEKRYATAYTAEGGQLDKANGRTADTIDIFETCERLANEARPGGK